MSSDVMLVVILKLLDLIKIKLLFIAFGFERAQHLKDHPEHVGSPHPIHLGEHPLLVRAESEDALHEVPL